MKQNIKDIADQIKADHRTTKALDILTALLDEKTKKFIHWTYTDPKIRDTYNALRTNATRSDKSRRLVVKFPNKVVFYFLDDIFSAQYGADWLSNKTTFTKILKNEDLIKPWVIGKI